MRDIFQSTDRAINEMRSVPGGVEMITTMHEQLMIPGEKEGQQQPGGAKQPGAAGKKEDKEGSEGITVN